VRRRDQYLRRKMQGGKTEITMEVAKGDDSVRSLQSARSKGSGKALSPSSKAAQIRIGNAARKNLYDIFESSDNPQELKSSLISVATEDPKLTFAMLRFGWEKTLTIRRERAVSVGFVGALIFSVALQMSVVPLEPSRSLSEASAPDFWSDARDTFEHIYHVLITLGAIFSAVSVVNSALYILWIQIYVSDSDDFIWFCRQYSVTYWVDAPMVFALLFSVLAVAFASVAIYVNPVASICFFAVVGLLAFSVIAFILGVIPGERRMRENFEGIYERYHDLIEEAFATVANGTGGDADAKDSRKLLD
jgi:hypothetical protein